MSRWPEVRAGDVLELIREPVTPQAETAYTEIGVRSFGKGIFHKPATTGLDIGSKRVFAIRPDELVLNIVFAWEGAVAVSSEADAGTIGSHRFLTYRADRERADLGFVCWYLTSDAGRRALMSASPGAAGRNRTLSAGRFESLGIPLPSIDEQRHIAGRLAATRERVARLESNCTSTLTTSALRESLLRRVDLDVGPRVELADVMTAVDRTVNVDPDAMYEMTGVYSFGRGLMRRSAIGGRDTSYRQLHRLEADDVVFAKLNAWEGAIAVVSPDMAGRHLSTEFPTFAVDRALAEPAFVEACLLRPSVWAAMTPRGSMVRRKRTSESTFLAATIPIPSLDDQRRTLVRLRLVAQIEQRIRRRSAIGAALSIAALNEVFSSFGD